MKSRFVQRENYDCLKLPNRIKAFIEQEFVNLKIPVRLESLSSFFCDRTKLVDINTNNIVYEDNNINCRVPRLQNRLSSILQDFHVINIYFQVRFLNI